MAASSFLSHLKKSLTCPVGWKRVANCRRRADHTLGRGLMQHCAGVGPNTCACKLFGFRHTGYVFSWNKTLQFGNQQEKTKIIILISSLTVVLSPQRSSNFIIFPTCFLYYCWGTWNKGCFLWVIFFHSFKLNMFIWKLVYKIFVNKQFTEKKNPLRKLRFAITWLSTAWSLRPTPSKRC